jgi:hypothetical protein
MPQTSYTNFFCFSIFDSASNTCTHFQLTMELHKLLETVNSKESFLHFVDALKRDRIDAVEKEKTKPSSPYGPGANGWENGTIEDFLDAMHSYGQDSSEIKAEPNWRMFALLLMAGKAYE